MAEFLAMNRFQVKEGHEPAFEKMWRERESFLADVPGFVSFRLLRAEAADGTTLFATHTLWDDEAAFRAWTKSEAFAKAHQQVRDLGPAMREMHAAPPKMESFTTVLREDAGSA